MTKAQMGSTERMFLDRHDAGRQLAAALRGYAKDNPVVLALPRGGVPVAFEVAKALGAELDLLFVRKIGAPGHDELGIGAVVDGPHPQLVLNESLARRTGAGRDYVEARMARELDEMERRREAYKKGEPPVDFSGCVVILVDDGIATGGTVKAALRGISRNNPSRLVLAVPVAPAEVIEEMNALSDEVICLATPEPFQAVGLHYVDFTQTTDSEVEELLAAAKVWRNGNRP